VLNRVAEPQIRPSREVRALPLAGNANGEDVLLALLLRPATAVGHPEGQRSAGTFAGLVIEHWLCSLSRDRETTRDCAASARPDAPR
jgi:hypothetical protein